MAVCGVDRLAHCILLHPQRVIVSGKRGLLEETTHCRRFDSHRRIDAQFTEHDEPTLIPQSDFRQEKIMCHPHAQGENWVSHRIPPVGGTSHCSCDRESSTNLIKGVWLLYYFQPVWFITRVLHYLKTLPAGLQS